MAKKSGLWLIALGVLLFFGAGFADLYQVKANPKYTVWIYPYTQWVFPLILAGIALFVLGFALIVYPSQKQNPNSIAPPPPAAYCCKQCGAIVSPNQKYCPSCGRQLEWR